MAINKLSKYHVIVEELKAKILGGILMEGVAVASENQLSKEYDTSRVTVRKALAVLINDGYIYTVQGKGNFVCTPKISDYTVRFQDEIHIWESKLISAEIIKPDMQTRIHMQLHSAEKIIEVKNFILQDNETIGYSIKYLLYNPKEPILEKEFHYINLEEKSENGTGKNIWLKALAADETIAKQLKLSIGHPMISLETKTENASHEIIGYEKSYIMGDRYHIVGK